MSMLTLSTYLFGRKEHFGVSGNGAEAGVSEDPASQADCNFKFGMQNGCTEGGTDSCLEASTFVRNQSSSCKSQTEFNSVPAEEQAEMEVCCCGDPSVTGCCIQLPIGTTATNSPQTCNAPLLSVGGVSCVTDPTTPGCPGSDPADPIEGACVTMVGLNASGDTITGNEYCNPDAWPIKNCQPLWQNVEAPSGSWYKVADSSESYNYSDTHEGLSTQTGTTQMGVGGFMDNRTSPWFVNASTTGGKAMSCGNADVGYVPATSANTVAFNTSNIDYTALDTARQATVGVAAWSNQMGGACDLDPETGLIDTNAIEEGRCVCLYGQTPFMLLSGTDGQTPMCREFSCEKDVVRADGAVIPIGSKELGGELCINTASDLDGESAAGGCSDQQDKFGRLMVATHLRMGCPISASAAGRDMIKEIKQSAIGEQGITSIEDLGETITNWTDITNKGFVPSCEFNVGNPYISVDGDGQNTPACLTTTNGATSGNKQCPGKTVGGDNLSGVFTNLDLTPGPFNACYFGESVSKDGLVKFKGFQARFNSEGTVCNNDTECGENFCYKDENESQGECVILEKPYIENPSCCLPGSTEYKCVGGGNILPAAYYDKKTGKKIDTCSEKFDMCLAAETPQETAMWCTDFTNPNYVTAAVVTPYSQSCKANPVPWMGCCGSRTNAGVSCSGATKNLDDTTGNYVCPKSFGAREGFSPQGGWSSSPLFDFDGLEVLSPLGGCQHNVKEDICPKSCNYCNEWDRSFYCDGTARTIGGITIDGLLNDSFNDSFCISQLANAQDVVSRDPRCQDQQKVTIGALGHTRDIDVNCELLATEAALGPECDRSAPKGFGIVGGTDGTYDFCPISDGSTLSTCDMGSRLNNFGSVPGDSSEYINAMRDIYEDGGCTFGVRRISDSSTDQNMCFETVPGVAAGLFDNQQAEGFANEETPRPGLACQLANTTVGPGIPTLEGVSENCVPQAQISIQTVNCEGEGVNCSGQGGYGCSSGEICNDIPYSLTCGTPTQAGNSPIKCLPGCPGEEPDCVYSNMVGCEQCRNDFLNGGITAGSANTKEAVESCANAVGDEPIEQTTNEELVEFMKMVGMNRCTTKAGSVFDMTAGADCGAGSSFGGGAGGSFSASGSASAAGKFSASASGGGAVGFIFAGGAASTSASGSASMQAQLAASGSVQANFNAKAEASCAATTTSEDRQFSESIGCEDIRMAATEFNSSTRISNCIIDKTQTNTTSRNSQFNEINITVSGLLSCNNININQTNEMKSVTTNEISTSIKNELALESDKAIEVLQTITEDKQSELGAVDGNPGKSIQTNLQNIEDAVNNHSSSETVANFLSENTQSNKLNLNVSGIMACNTFNLNQTNLGDFTAKNIVTKNLEQVSSAIVNQTSTTTQSSDVKKVLEGFRDPAMIAIFNDMLPMVMGMFAISSSCLGTTLVGMALAAMMAPKGGGSSSDSEAVAEAVAEAAAEALEEASEEEVEEFGKALITAFGLNAE